MAAAPITETVTVKKEFNHPAFEIVNFTTASIGDYYDSKKFGQIEGAIACTTTADDEEIQVTDAIQSNGTQRITLTQSATNAITGWLIIVGRK